MASEFRNYITNSTTTDVDEVAQETDGRWYIAMGYAGFNSTRNNYDGYSTQAKAIARVRYYQNRSK